MSRLSKLGWRPNFLCSQAKRGFSMTSAESVNQVPRPTHPLFSIVQVGPDIYHIEERFFESWNKANIFFFSGTKRDLLVDTGTGIFNLFPFLRFVGLDSAANGKKLSVVLTHSHFDHSGGLHHFQGLPNTDLFIHSAEKRCIVQGDQVQMASWVTPNEVVPKPSNWKARQFRVHPVHDSDVKALKGSDTIDLGNMKLEVIHLPGHSPGSIGLLERDLRVMVTGDTLYRTDEELIDWYPSSSVSQMAESVERIEALAAQGDLDLVLPGHNEVMEGREGILRQTRSHLAKVGLGRKLAKKMSWCRTNFILRANRIMPLPEVARDMLKK